MTFSPSPSFLIESLVWNTTNSPEAATVSPLAPDLP